MRIHDRCVKSQCLPQLVEEQMEEDERAQLEAHLETCEPCQQALESMVDEDATASRVGLHLRKSPRDSDKALLDVLERIQSSTGATIAAEAPEPIRLADFAVDYLRPSENPEALGRLGVYDVSEVIGSGGMGIVLKGHDAKLNRIVAIKVLTPAFALNPTARKRFLREAQAAAAVGHPNVVTIHSVDEDRLPYLVMEFVDGVTLEQRLDSEGFLQVNQILRIGIQVAAGLAAAHAQGLVHRDVKPGNILLENGLERVKLTDFGLARAADDASVTREGTVVGTPQYMSPEQARGEFLDQTSDLFSLGSVLYTLSTGRAPFRAESLFGVMRKIADEQPTRIRELNPEIPDWLSAIIQQLMAKDKDNRFQSASDVQELLEACLNHTQQPTVAELPVIPKPKKTKRISLVLKTSAGVIVMLMFATSLLFFFGPMSPSPEKDANRSTKTSAFTKNYEVAFVNADEVGTLNVDIKAGSIHVTGYDGDKVLVELSVPNFARSTSESQKGLRELQPNPLDFDIEKSKEQIKLDGNSYQYITDLKIKVPRKTNLILDTYRAGVIRVENVEGTFKLRSHNNNIHLLNVSGAGRVWSYNGNLTADFASLTRGQKLELETYNGSIELKVPKDTQANLKYRSGSGKVLTDFNVDLSKELVQTIEENEIGFDKFLRGKINGGGPELTLETEKGDIRLQKRMEESLL